MEVTASISDFRNLSQSELIAKNLFSSLQVDGRVQVSDKVNVADVRFHPGTCEAPLVITLKNRQTDTVMYVRNVPLPVVQRLGVFEQWIAVYPPGDPQNLHFDEVTAPKPESPQVRVCVRINQAQLSPRHSLGFAPPARTAPAEDALRVSQIIGNQRPPDDIGFSLPSAMSRSELPVNGRSSLPAGVGTPARADSSIREKEWQAEKIKEKVNAMVEAQRRAQTGEQQVQDYARTLDELRQSLKSLELQIADQSSALASLQNEKNELKSHCDQLEAKVRQRETAFNDVRANRDDIDRQLSQALAQREQQRMAMDNSTRSFESQVKAMAMELDQSKTQVTSLNDTLKDREQAIRQLEQEKNSLEGSANDGSVSRMQGMLDRTTSDMRSVQSTLAADKSRHQAATVDYERLQEKIQEKERELERLKGGIGMKAGERDRLSKTLSETTNELETKNKESASHAAKIAKLEGQLAENRQQLGEMGSRITELHMTMRQRDDASQQLESQIEEYNRQLKTTQDQTQAAESDRVKHETEMVDLDAKIREALASVDSMQSNVRADELRYKKESDDLAMTCSAKQEELLAKGQELEKLRRNNEDAILQLEARKAELRDRRNSVKTMQAEKDTLQNTVHATDEQARAQQIELDKLSQTESQNSHALTQTKQRVEIQRGQVASIRLQSMERGQEMASKVKSLDETISGLRQELNAIAHSKRSADLGKREISENLEESSRQVESLQREVSKVTAEHELELDATKVCSRDLETAQGEVNLKEKELVRLKEDLRASEYELAAAQKEIASGITAEKQQIDDVRSEEAQLSQEKSTLDLELSQTRTMLDKEADDLNKVLAEKSRLEQEFSKLQTIDETMKERLQQAQSLQEEQVAGEDEKLKTAQTQKRNSVDKISALTSKCAELQRQIADMEAEKVKRSADLNSIKSSLQKKNQSLDETQKEQRRKDQEYADLEARFSYVKDDLKLTLAANEAVQAEITSMGQTLQTIEEEAADMDNLEREQKSIRKHTETERINFESKMRQQGRQIEDAAQVLQRTKSDIEREKKSSIQNQVEQIKKLETDIGSLTLSNATLAEEKQKLEKELNRKKNIVKVEVDSKISEHSGRVDELKKTISDSKAATLDLKQKTTSLQQSLAAFNTGAEQWQKECADRDSQIQKVVDDMTRSGKEATETTAKEQKRLKVHHGLSGQLKEEETALKSELDALATRSNQVLELHEERIDGLERIEAQLKTAKTNVAETKIETEKHQALADERAQQLKKLETEIAQTYATNSDAVNTSKQLQELEENSQKMSDDLTNAQEELRTLKQGEEDGRQDLPKVKAKVKQVSDTMAHQLEHGNLQFETIQKLEDEKKTLESEVEVLTMGLHDADQRNEYLHKENLLMQQQVEGLYQGTLQEWAAEVHRVKVQAEVAKYKEELEQWKIRADELRQEKRNELAKMKGSHNETMTSLNEQIARLEDEVGAQQQLKRSKSSELKKASSRNSGNSGMPASLQGLVVPQRPLPPHANRRKALIVGVNYPTSHAPLKGSINDAWNIQCLLRYTLQYPEDNVKLLLDSSDGRSVPQDRLPTKANILEGLSWLTRGAQAGDNLILYFSGYGAQHPRTSKTDQYEAYVVPCDFGADLPFDFFSQRKAGDNPTDLPKVDDGTGYRLISLLEIIDTFSRLPPACRVSLVLDCCHSVVPNVSPTYNMPSGFPLVQRGRVNYAKLRDFVSRPRFLDLPVIPVRHTPKQLRTNAFPECRMHCFSACQNQEWCSEFPIEGTVQGAFTWSFIKALAAGHFHCGVYQHVRMVTKIISDLRQHFKGVEQTPTLQVSSTASMQDVVLFT